MRKPSKVRLEQIRIKAEELAAQVNKTGVHPIAQIIKCTEHQWHVRCPYCCEIHFHSPGEGSNIPHCKDLRDMPNYAIKL